MPQGVGMGLDIHSRRALFLRALLPQNNVNNLSIYKRPHCRSNSIIRTTHTAPDRTFQIPIPHDAVPPSCPTRSSSRHSGCRKWTLQRPRWTGRYMYKHQLLHLRRRKIHLRSVPERSSRHQMLLQNALRWAW